MQGRNHFRTSVTKIVKAFDESGGTLSCIQWDHLNALKIPINTLYFGMASQMHCLHMHLVSLDETWIDAAHFDLN
jgi:hypothetical protein